MRAIPVRLEVAMQVCVSSVNGTNSRSGLSSGPSRARGAKFSLNSTRSTLSSYSRLTVSAL